MLWEALLFVFAAKRAAIVDGVDEEEASSSRNDCRGDGFAGIGWSDHSNWSQEKLVQ